MSTILERFTAKSGQETSLQTVSPLMNDLPNSKGIEEIDTQEYSRIKSDEGADGQRNNSVQMHGAEYEDCPEIWVPDAGALAALATCWDLWL